MPFEAADEIAKSLLGSDDKGLIEDLVSGCEEPNDIENITPIDFSVTQAYEQAWQRRKG